MFNTILKVLHTYTKFSVANSHVFSAGTFLIDSYEVFKAYNTFVFSVILHINVTVIFVSRLSPVGNIKVNGCFFLNRIGKDVNITSF